MPETVPGHILFDAERMKYPHTGLYHFCLQLGNAIKESIGDPTRLHYYVPSSLKGFFGARVQYEIQQSYHKWFPISSENIDVWHATHQSTDYFPFRRKVPVVLTIHDLNFMLDEEKSDQKKEKYLTDIQRKIEASSHIVTISEFVKAELERFISIKDKPVSIIYNGCNIHPVSDKDQMTMPSLLEEDFLFTIGTITVKKNFHVLPALLVNNNMKLVIAGVVQQKKYLQRIIDEAEQLGVKDRILFTGGITEKEKVWYYRHCKAFVFPSIAEGFGLPVVEAMFHGKPVFLSTHTSLPEIGGEHAFYFSDFHPESMRNVLQQGLQHFSVEQAELLKKQAEKFQWSTAATQYLSIYNSLCKPV